MKNNKEKYSIARMTALLGVSRSAYYRLLRKYGLNAKTKRKFVKTTDSSHDLAICENILNRDFRAAEPGEKWVSDITHGILVLPKSGKNDKKEGWKISESTLKK